LELTLNLFLLKSPTVLQSGSTSARIASEARRRGFTVIRRFWNRRWRIRS